MKNDQVLKSGDYSLRYKQYKTRYTVSIFIQQTLSEVQPHCFLMIVPFAGLETSGVCYHNEE